MTCNNLGCALALQGRLAEARAQLGTALRLFILNFGPRHPTTRAARQTLARCPAAADSVQPVNR